MARSWITADLYTHVLDDLKAEAADRLDIIFRDAEVRRAEVAEREVWAKCGPPEKLTAKKVSKITRFLVAPTGIESESAETNEE